MRTIPLDPATEEEILALDPEHITEKGVREILLRAPDVWHSVKKYGYFEAQVLIRAKKGPCSVMTDSIAHRRTAVPALDTPGLTTESEATSY